jgi:hypothetical protein
MTDEREVLRLLRRLEDGTRLERGGDGIWTLAGRRRRAIVPAGLVSLLQSRGWLDERGCASEAGRAFLARAQNVEDPFASQHRLLATRLVKDERGRDCYVVVNAAESPIGFLRQRGFISHEQFGAGERLRRDFTMAQLTPRMGVDFEAPIGRRSRKPETLITETALAAKQRFNRAMKAAGPGLSDVLFDVCCILRGLEESERIRSWPRHSAMVVLRLALDRLAGHYGLNRRRGARTRSWVKEGEMR